MYGKFKRVFVKQLNWTQKHEYSGCNNKKKIQQQQQQQIHTYENATNPFVLIVGYLVHVTHKKRDDITNTTSNNHSDNNKNKIATTKQLMSQQCKRPRPPNKSITLK